MKKTLLTIAATVAITTSAQAMDAVSQAKMKDWVSSATPLLMQAEACDSPNYIKAYETAYEIAHVSAGVPQGDVWSSIIDMEFNLALLGRVAPYVAARCCSNGEDGLNCSCDHSLPEGKAETRQLV